MTRRNSISNLRTLLYSGIFLAAVSISTGEEAPTIKPPSCCAGSSRATSLPIDLMLQPEHWKLADEAAWKWEKADGENILSLIAQSKNPPKIRSPRNLAWFQSYEWKDFTLTLECMLTKFDSGNNDLCIAFVGAAEDQYYYAHLGETADDVHHQIHIVNQADRKASTTYRSSGTPWKENQWHKLKIIRNSANGDIGVWFDDMKTPILAASDTTFTWGKIGLGSFDDTGKFRQVKISGTRRASPQ
jgi:hypothetical protein